MVYIYNLVLRQLGTTNANSHKEVTLFAWHKQIPEMKSSLVCILGQPSSSNDPTTWHGKGSVTKGHRAHRDASLEQT